MKPPKKSKFWPKRLTKCRICILKSESIEEIFTQFQRNYHLFPAMILVESLELKMI